MPATASCIAPGADPCGDANKKFGTNFSSGAVGPNNALVNNNNHLIAPRVGIAYDVFGNGKTAVRVGAGEFYQRERVSRYTLVANAPFAVSVSNYSRALGGATPATLTGASASPSGGMDPRAILPSSWQWNLTVEQTLAKNTVLQTSYVGNRGIHLTSSYDVNGIAPNNWAAATFLTGSAQQALRPFANYGALAYWSHQGDSNYNGLQTLFRTPDQRLPLPGRLHLVAWHRQRPHRRFERRHGRAELHQLPQSASGSRQLGHQPSRTSS